MQDDRLAIGIDAGTGGVRALAVSTSGEVAAAAREPFPPPRRGLPRGWHEQDPESWWTAAQSCLAEVAARLGKRAETVVALAVDGTSGTLVCMNGAGEAVRPALMYNDARAGAEAEELCALAAGHCRRHGYRFAPSFAAARILWLLRREPETVAATRWFCHQADYIAARLGAPCGVSDYSNALKTGFDLFEERWPDWVGACEGMGERLPEVVAPGARLGELSPAAASATGLPAGTAVVAGATDGTAAFLASGAHLPGDDNTTLGTTLVFKRLASGPAASPDGLVYSHKLPGGYWLPGAASNTGGEWIGAQFPGQDPAALDRQAEPLLPSGLVAYPLARKGERFPFACAGAEGFCDPEPASGLERFAANLQGVAFTERLAYEVLDAAAGAGDGGIYATGAAARSDVWLQLRADATGRSVHRPECPESAFGSAVLAASVLLGGLWPAARAMVRTERTFAPDRVRGAALEERYAAFRRALEKRGYLEPG